MSPELYRTFYPDWRESRRNAVGDALRAEDTAVWVALSDAAPVGFVAVKYDADSRMGEIYTIAVDPEHQRRGSGEALTQFAMDRMRDAGMTVAMVETGSDPGHAPARRTYAKTGFELLPVSRYFKKL